MLCGTFIEYWRGFLALAVCIVSNKIQNNQISRRTKRKCMETISCNVMCQWGDRPIWNASTKEIPLGKRQMMSLWRPWSCMTNGIISAKRKNMVKCCPGWTARSFSARTSVNGQRNTHLWTNDTHMNHNLNDGRMGEKKRNEMSCWCLKWEDGYSLFGTKQA